MQPSPPPPNATTGTAPASRALKGRYLLLSLAILVVDQWSKWMIDTHLPELTSVRLIPNFLNLTHVKNTGVAFGLFAGLGRDGGTWVLALAGLFALALVAIYFWRLPAENRLLHTALALVLGGAVGNLIDRLAAGAVTDFVDVYVGTYHWHTFNVADSAISIGIGLILLETLLQHRRSKTSEAAV